VANLSPDGGENGVRRAQMQVFDNLHIVGGNN
jgi:hypothetical protein